MTTIQIYNLHLINGDVIPMAEAFDLKGKKTMVSRFQELDDEDMLCITDLLLGSCYIKKKHILYITTGDVRVDAEPDGFLTNMEVLHRRVKYGS